MAVKKTGLGRGLDALLGDVEMASASAKTSGGDGAGDGDLRHIPVDLLSRGEFQPRQDMHTESLEELAQSIRAQGMVQPIVVRPLPAAGAAGPARYEIVAGERRWRAAQMAGLDTVPAVVRELPDTAAVAIALIENIQRENLNPLEEAEALRRLIDEFQLTHQETADSIGRSRAAVSNLLRLLELGATASRLVREGELEMGHARALLALVDHRKQAEVAARIVRKGLSVRETENLVKRTVSGGGGGGGRGGRPLDPDIRRLQDDLSEKLGARVRIDHGARGRGKLVVRYNSLDELEGILAHIE